MADTVTYEIHIVQDGGESQKSAPKAVADSPDGQNSKPKGTSPKKMAAAGFGIALAASKKIASTQISQISLRTGHATLQQRTQFVYSIVDSGISAVSSIVAGGMVGGGAGAAVAAIGVVLNIGNKIADIAIRADQLNTQRIVESYTIQQANIRAGCGGDRIGRNKT